MSMITHAMTKCEVRQTLNNMSMNELKQLFVEYFKTNGLVLDLMDLATWSKLRRYIVDQFVNEFQLDELEFILKNIIIT